MDNQKVYDIIIVGGGPGGYTAALYGARAGLSVLVLEKLYAGGQMSQTHQIDNYPGFPEGVDGFQLAQNMQHQAERFGAKTVLTEVQKLDLLGSPKQVITDSGEYLARTVILAAGAGPKELGIEKEKELTGRGVAYCAACDGNFYRGKVVAVVGGGNSAVADALLLSRIAQKVYLIHRRDSLRATRIYEQALKNAENVEILWNSQVVQLHHEEKLSAITVEQMGDAYRLPVDGLFISVGRKPATELVADQLALDPGGYLIAGEDTKTDIPGVYAVGDIRTKQVRQIVTAVSDGAVAAHIAEEYLADLSKGE